MGWIFLFFSHLHSATTTGQSQALAFFPHTKENIIAHLQAAISNSFDFASAMNSSIFSYNCLFRGLGCTILLNYNMHYDTLLSFAQPEYESLLEWRLYDKSSLFE